MSNEELILGGLKLMVFGMGMVYFFLILMIWAMGLMKKALAPYVAAFEPKPKAPPKAKAAAVSGDDLQLAAIAAAAVELARTKK